MTNQPAETGPSMTTPVGVQHVYQVGKVAKVMERERDSRLRGVGYGPLTSAWVTYAGGEVPVFEAYIRWARDGSLIRVNTLTAEDSRRGRMPVIMDALEALAPLIIVEQVGNPFVARWLIARGYTAYMEPGMVEVVGGGFPCNYRKVIKHDAA